MATRRLVLEIQRGGHRPKKGLSKNSKDFFFQFNAETCFVLTDFCKNADNSNTSTSYPAYPKI